LLHQLVRADHRAGALVGWGFLGGNETARGRLQEIPELAMFAYQSLDLFAQAFVAGTGVGEKSGTRAGACLLQGSDKKVTFIHGRTPAIARDIYSSVRNSELDSARKMTGGMGFGMWGQVSNLP